MVLKELYKNPPFARIIKFYLKKWEGQTHYFFKEDKLHLLSRLHKRSMRLLNEEANFATLFLMNHNVLMMTTLVPYLVMCAEATMQTPNITEGMVRFICMMSIIVCRMYLTELNSHLFC